MKLILPLLLMSLVPARVTPPITQRQIHDTKLEHQRSGRWYMGKNGHAVFCYGPTMTVQTADGFQKVATFCKGGHVIVPLHE